MTIDQETIKEKKADGYRLIRLREFDVPVLVFYKQDWLNQPQNDFRCNHAEFYSEYVSETGYRSHFFYPQELEAVKEHIKHEGEAQDLVYDYLVAVAEHCHNELLEAKPTTNKVVAITNQQGLF